MSFSLRTAARAAAWSVVAGLAIGSCGVIVPQRVASKHVGSGGETSSGMIEVTEATKPPAGARLVMPAVISIPYVVAGEGSATAEIKLTNTGDAPLEDLAWTLTGDPSISLHAAPSTIAAGETVDLALTWSGSPVEAIAQATLSVALPTGTADIPVFAVAGDPALPTATWDAVEGAGGTLAGVGITIPMPSAPFPVDPTSKYTDASVRVFVPSGYRDRGSHDMVVHFHGWNTNLGATLATHLYQQHLYASGSNAILVVPQGPIDAPSGDFGKLMGRGGLARMLTQVLVMLYRDERIASPVRGDVVITAHSGGYQAAAAALDPSNALKVTSVNLFDALYGYESVFEGVVAGGGALRATFTETGGTVDPTLNVYNWLLQRGVKVALDPTQRARKDDAPVFHFAPTTHDGTTRLGGGYGETLRWRLRHSRSGPRIELREVVPSDHTAIARWLSPPDEDATGFVVETSIDGESWTPAAKVEPSVSEAAFPLATGARVRVKAIMNGIAAKDVLASDNYRVDPDAKILVVDGFDRVLDGAFGGLSHDFAARVGEAAGPVATISHRAVTEDAFDLLAWPTVIWLLGDEGAADVSLSAAEQTAILDYVHGGGHLVMSGSEVAFDIGQTATGADFLAQCFGAAYYADDSGSREVAGHGRLARVASFGFGGKGAGYVAASSDALGPVEGGRIVLEYGSGQPAAVGIPGRGALVGFPLELTDSNDALGTVVKALVSFASGG